MRKNKRQKKTRHGSKRDNRNRESRGVEALTVAWMLCCLVTLLALLGSTAIRSVLWQREMPSNADLLCHLLTFISLVTGALCVLLTPLVLKYRATPPPLSVTAGACILGIIPWVALTF